MRLKTNFSYLQTCCFQYQMEINNTVIYVLRRDLYQKANYQCRETPCHPASLTFFYYDAYGRIRLQSWRITWLHCEVICNSHAPSQCVEPTIFFINISVYLFIANPPWKNHFKTGNSQLNSCTKILLSQITLARQYIPHLSRNSTFLYSIHNTYSPIPILSPMHPTFLFPSNSHRIL